MSTTRRYLSLRLVGVLLVFGLLATAASSANAGRRLSRKEQRSSVLSLLAAYELQLHKAVLDTLGHGLDETLVEIASDPRVAPRVRVRSVAALGYYPTPRAQAYLQGLLLERRYVGNRFGVQIRRQALRSLGKAFGDAASHDLLSLRTDPEPLIREAVAHGLSDGRAVSALPILRTWLDQETELTVRIAIDRAIAHIQGR